MRNPEVLRIKSPLITIGAKIITHTTFIVGALIWQLYTHQLHNFNR